jgi:hypothetical protein
MNNNFFLMIGTIVIIFNNVMQLTVNNLQIKVDWCVLWFIFVSKHYAITVNNLQIESRVMCLLLWFIFAPNIMW